MKITYWYKCLVCQRCFEFPKALIVHRRQSECRAKYRKIHRERLQRTISESSPNDSDESEFNSGHNSDETQSDSISTIECEEQGKECEILENDSNQDISSDGTQSHFSVSLKNQRTECGTLENNEAEINSEFTSDETQSDFSLSHEKHRSDFDTLETDSSEDESITTPYINSDETQSDFTIQPTEDNISTFSNPQKPEIKLTVQKPSSEEHKCYFCHLKFPTFDELKTHFSSHNLDGPSKSDAQKPSKRFLKCRICREEFILLNKFKSHMKSIHRFRRPFVCSHKDICTKRFEDYGELKEHISVAHQDDEITNPNFCDICAKSFATSASLKTHIANIHDKVKPFECNFCSRAFATKQNMQRHVCPKKVSYSKMPLKFK